MDGRATETKKFARCPVSEFLNESLQSALTAIDRFGFISIDNLSRRSRYSRFAALCGLGAFALIKSRAKCVVHPKDAQSLAWDMRNRFAWDIPAELPDVFT